MVVAYDGGPAAEFGVVDVELVVVDGVVEVVPTVICAWATPDSSTQPTTGYQISCERRELIVMGEWGHPGTGPMVGWANVRTGTA